MDHQTETIVKLIRSSDPLQDIQALTAARDGFFDYIASSLAAVQEPAVAKLRDHVAREPSSARLVGANIRVSAQNAALCNGFQAHYLNYDNAHFDVRGHPSAPILSVLLAVSDTNTDGDAFLRAYIIGVELITRLGDRQSLSL
ncbi:MmgE/PrpD family protein [Sporolactobacillus shoreicorticis]|uniref:MmgE/PrpD family protein n=1 Tax=Sporolactobacillus shoreicorticis TaxID=1923877 RepID=A0ABW5S3P2_9BACL|nr:MmgE/PrpD family protein [Sporolactobacillus shoreicorticis]MCO7127126.1 MmgE/PrpD family protein [Sporolactobacillus shoreicorticis]